MTKAVLGWGEEITIAIVRAIGLEEIMEETYQILRNFLINYSQMALPVMLGEEMIGKDL